jgi:hypothetical protein
MRDERELGSYRIGEIRTPTSSRRTLWSERAAVREHLGGMARADAEQAAFEDLQRWLGRSA